MKHMSVGEYIKGAYLEPLNLTYKDLAKSTGLSYSTVSMVFAGEYPLTLPIAVLFSKALGVSTEHLALLDGGREMIDQYDGVEVLYERNHQQ